MLIKRLFVVSCFTTAFFIQSFAQFGIKAGVNMANEIRSFHKESIRESFKSENLTGYHVGVVYQVPFSNRPSGFAAEVGALLSQKGSFFKYNKNDGLTDNAVRAYNELNYVELPISMRYKLSLGLLGGYASAGLYAGYMLNGKTLDEATKEVMNEMSAMEFANKLDYGYSLGIGLEVLKKIQIGFTWTEGLKNNEMDIKDKRDASIIPVSSTNRIFSVGLTYLF